MKRGSLYTVLYAVGMGGVCAFLLTWAGEFTAKARGENAEAERMRNVLGVLGISLEGGGDASSERVLEIYERAVTEDRLGELAIYAYKKDGAAQAYAVPFAGPGLWGPIRGYLALEPDFETIRGVTFYEQEETPGLGGEIAAACSCSPGQDWRTCTAWFRHQFKGKKIIDAVGKPGIRIVRGGKAKAQNEVDGFTGATMTGNKVEAMLNAAIKQVHEGRRRPGEGGEGDE